MKRRSRPRTLVLARPAPAPDWALAAGLLAASLAALMAGLAGL